MAARGLIDAEFGNRSLIDLEFGGRALIDPELSTVVSAGGTLFTLSLSGALTPAGVVVKSVVLAKTGALTPAGLLAKQDQKRATGAMTPAGALVKAALKAFAAAMTPAGTLVKQDQKKASGAMTPSGALVKQDQKLVTGTLTPTGVVTTLRTVTKALTAAMTPTGSLLKAVSKAAFTAAITPSGAVVKQDQKKVSGALTPTGTVVRAGTRLLTGALTPLGNVFKAVLKPLSGTITSTGVLTMIKVVLKTVAGTLTMSGTVAKQDNKALAGTLTMGGVVTKQDQRRVSGALTPSGALAKLVAKGPQKNIFDDFNRANENPIAGNWTCEVLSSPPLPAPWGQSELSGNMVWGLGSFSNPVWRNDINLGADVYVQARSYGMPWPGVFVRLQPGEGTAYFYMWPDRNTATLYRFVGGSVFTALLNFDMSGNPLADGDMLRMEVEGIDATVTLRVYKNGSLLNTYADTDASRIVLPGKLGIHTDGVHGSGLDDFSAGTLRGIGGLLSLSGILTQIKVVLKSLTGTLIPSGSVAKQSQKIVGGVVTPTAIIAKSTLKPVGGAVAPTGTLGKFIRLVKTATLAFVGVITNNPIVQRAKRRRTLGYKTGTRA